MPEGAHASPCLGLCERAPAVAAHGRRASSRARMQLPARRRRRCRRRASRACACCAGSPPASTRSRSTRTRSAGGYDALRRALELGAGGVLREVAESRLLGRGGAAFPTGAKWEAVAKQPAQPHYLVCNADESEPGTFKDRVLMEEDPFALVEAMTIAALATGCEHGFVYVRAEYPLAHARLAERDRAGAARLLGDDVLDGRVRHRAAHRRRRVRLRRGDRALPVDRGLPRRAAQQAAVPGRGRPLRQADGREQRRDALQRARRRRRERRRVRSDRHRGLDRHAPLLRLRPRRAARASTRCRSATPLRELLELAGAEPPKAVLLGGAAGSFLGPDQLDLPLTFEDARAAGATLGSGVVIVYDESADLVDAVLRIAEFFRDESCGQCVPCRVGTVRQEEALHRLAAGHANGDELAVLAELAQVMRDASICGLGQTAANAVASAIAQPRSARR